jgi:hypothetical protein
MTTLAVALRDLLDHDLPLESAVERHFTDGYRQRTNGRWDDRDGFVSHIAHLRTIVDALDVTVLEEVIEGVTYAERHVVDILKRDGARVSQEVYVFGELASDGRFERIEETTLMLSGSDEDRGIGNAR